MKNLKIMDIFVFFTPGSTKPLYFLRSFWIFHRNQKHNGNTMFCNNGNLKNHCIFIVFWKYNGFVLPDVKNTNSSISFFYFHNKPKKHGESKNQKIQKSKTFTDFPKSSGFWDFFIFGFFYCWSFMKTVCLLFAVLISY